jgi:NAD(P)-dependent dehydrogenase (short-subunit alcohol dehydrogenase family)
MSAPVTADLRGRTCVVTGASSGIGKETARELSRLGATVILACRSAERGQSARAEIARDTGNERVEVGLVDFASQASIRAFARDLAERHPELHVLVNNAGMWSARRRFSPDGIELTWATNQLGYFLGTELLAPLLQRTGSARIVVVASDFAGDLDLDDVNFLRRRYDGMAAYRQSKQANRMWTWALARRLHGTGVTANALHPGGVATGIFSKGGGVLGASASTYMRLAGISPHEGADTVVWLSTAADVEGINGRYWFKRAERTCRFRDAAAEERLWERCAEMTTHSRG